MPKFNDSPTVSLETTQVTITNEHRYIAEQLAAIHGKVRLAREASGVHLYCASPVCLEKYGIIELSKMHLAVNLDKAVKGENLCAQCMKTSKPYALSFLLKMPPLSARGIKNVKSEVQEVDNTEHLEDDGNGNMIPKRPGFCKPLCQLGDDHPAIQYIKYRGFDPISLYRQFRASYCEQEREGSYWRRLPGGFKDTPQGRIVFFVDVKGVQVGWQARLMEIDRKQAKYAWHPYEHQWIAIMGRQDPDHPWCPLPGFEGWDPAKYLFGKGIRRNKALMGFDAAVASNKQTGKRHCILVEGALDAAKFGPPALAILGKHFSEGQALLVAEHFDTAIYVADQDDAGAAAQVKVMQALASYPHVNFATCRLPKGVKDAGSIEFAKEEAQTLINQCLLKVK